MSTETKTEVGSYFVSNYPPFSQWKKERVQEIRDAFARPPAHDVPLGLYLHIPFCRKRCKFCYFRVYTQQNADMVKNYVDALDREVTLLNCVDLELGEDRQFRLDRISAATVVEPGELPSA